MPGILLNAGDVYVTNCFKQASTYGNLTVHFLNQFLTLDEGIDEADIESAIETYVAPVTINTLGNVLVENLSSGQYAYVKTDPLVIANTRPEEGITLYGFAVRDNISQEYIYLYMFPEVIAIASNESRATVIKFAFNRKY